MKINWKNETRNVKDLNPAEYNPRKMTTEQAEQLEKSIDRFELADPIIINADNTVIGGHMRLRILKKRGVKTVDVRVPENLLDKEAEKELNLRLNKSGGEWEIDKLQEFGKDFLIEVGFEESDIIGNVFSDSLFDSAYYEEESEQQNKESPKCPTCGKKLSSGDFQKLKKRAAI